MKRLVYNTYEELADDMLETIDEGDDACAVLFYDDAIVLIKELLNCEYTSIESIRINSEAYDGYDLEYYVQINEDYNIFVEPAWADGHVLDDGKVVPSGYLFTEAAKVFVDGDANSAILKSISAGACYEIELDIDSDDEDELDINVDIEFKDGVCEDFDEEALKAFLDNAEIRYNGSNHTINLFIDIGELLENIFK